MLASVSLNDTNNGPITLGGQVTGGSNSLTLSSGSGDQTLSGITTTGALRLTTTGIVSLDTGTYTIGSKSQTFNAVTTNGTLTPGLSTTFGGAVTLGSTTTIDSNGNNIDFASTVDALPEVGAGLTVNAGTGTTTFGGAVGEQVSPASLTATGGTIALNAGVTVNEFIALDSTGVGSALAINSTLAGRQIALTSNGPITEGANGVLDQTQLAIISAGPVSLTGANNVTDLAAEITGAGNGIEFRDNSTNLAIDTVTIPTDVATISATGITTNNGEIQIGTTVFGDIPGAAIAVNAPISSGGAAIELAATPGSPFTNNSTIASGNGNIVLIADRMSLSEGSPQAARAAGIVLGPATTNRSIGLGLVDTEETLDLEDVGSMTAGMQQIGYRAEDGAASFVGNITVGNAGITLNTANVPTLLLVTGGAGTVTQGGPIGFLGGTVGVIADTNITLTSGNSVGAVAGFTDGGLFSLSDRASLTVGSLALPTLGVAVANGLASATSLPSGNGLPANPLSGITASGPAAISATGGLTLAANVTASGQMVTLGADGGSITQTAGIITAGSLNATASDNVALNGSNNIVTLATGAAQGRFSLNNGTDLTVSGTAAGLASTTITVTGTLTVNGSVITNGGPIGLTANGINIGNGGLVTDGGTGTTTLTASNATIIDSGTLIAGTLTGSATEAATLAGATPFSNQVATLASFSASNLTLLDGTALTIAEPVAAEFLNITATGQMVLAGDISTVGAPLTQQSLSTPAVQGSTLQVVAPAADPATNPQFMQTGTVTLAGLTATAPTLRVQLPATGGRASFANLQGLGADLVLGLGSGTANGTIAVGGLLVLGRGGSASLVGSVRGITTSAAVALAQILPETDPAYTFNGCKIGLVGCAAVTLPPTPVPSGPPSITSINLSDVGQPVLGGLFASIPGLGIPPPPLLVSADLIFLALPPLLPGELMPQDFVLPNISFEDY